MNYENMTLDELKCEFKKRGLIKLDEKTELILLLKEHDKKIEAEQTYFKIYVKSIMGQTYTICIEQNSTVLVLKEKIQEKTSIPIDQQQLLKSGMNMVDNNKTLDYYNVTAGSVLHLLLNLRGD